MRFAYARSWVRASDEMQCKHAHFLTTKQNNLPTHNLRNDDGETVVAEGKEIQSWENIFQSKTIIMR